MNAKAVKRYYEIKKSIERRMAVINQAIADHASSDEEIHYGYIGDLAEVDDYLALAERFITDSEE